jgi:hypothetical protein
MTPPNRPARTRLPRIALAAAAVSAVLVGGCGTSNVDTASMERQLEQRIARASQLKPGDVKAECPRQEEAKVGNSFTCTLRYRGDERTFVITLEEGDRYTVRPGKP